MDLSIWRWQSIYKDAFTHDEEYLGNNEDMVPLGVPRAVAPYCLHLPSNNDFPMYFYICLFGICLYVYRSHIARHAIDPLLCLLTVVALGRLHRKNESNKFAYMGILESNEWKEILHLYLQTYLYLYLCLHLYLYV